MGREPLRQFSGRITPQAKMLVRRQIVANASPRERGLAGDMKAGYPGREKFQALITLEIIVWKHEDAATQADQPSGPEIV